MTRASELREPLIALITLTSVGALGSGSEGSESTRHDIAKCFSPSSIGRPRGPGDKSSQGVRQNKDGKQAPGTKKRVV